MTRDLSLGINILVISGAKLFERDGSAAAPCLEDGLAVFDLQESGAKFSAVDIGPDAVSARGAHLDIVRIDWFAWCG